MKKLFIFFLLLTTAIIFSYCSSSKKTATASAKTVSMFAGNVENVMMNSCTPCHFPSKGGRVKALDNYAAARDNIDEIIRRIELNPADKGFMPFKHPKLSQDTINIFKQWKADGLVEK